MNASQLNTTATYIVIANEGTNGCYLKAGERVKMVEGYSQRFRPLDPRSPGQESHSDDWYTNPSNLREATPAEAAGLIVGKKYEVITTRSGHSFSAGEIVTFYNDDATNHPGFRRDRDGYTQYLSVTLDVKPYVAPVVDTRSPAAKAGMVVGQLYEVVSRDRAGNHVFNTGDVVKFIRDDNSTCPKFQRVSDRAEHYAYIIGLKPYVEVKKTPAELFGLKVGDKARVKVAAHRSEVGDIVTLFLDDKTDVPEFTQKDGSRRYIDLCRLELFKPTPVEAAGYKIGDKFTVVEASLGWFVRGAVITLVRDDKSDTPEFQDTNGKIGFATLSKITPYVEPKKSRAELAGFKVNTAGRLVKAVNGFAAGTLVKLVRDDNSDMPYFEVTSGERAGSRSYFELGREVVVHNASMCEQAGIVAGKRFKVINERESALPLGSIVTLKRDDRDSTPLMTTLNGRDGFVRIVGMEAFEPTSIIVNEGSNTKITANYILSAEQRAAVERIITAG